MNDRQIQCFLEAGRLLNFTRAAENLLLPQPAVSRYISSLEEELGTPLFQRVSSRKVLLTPAGKAYYNFFQRMSIEFQNTKLSLSENNRALRIGINKSWRANSFLPEVVEKCREKDPSFRVTYECLDFKSLSLGLKEKRLDAVISFEDYLDDAHDFEVRRFTDIQKLIVFSDRLPRADQMKTPADFYSYDFLIADDPVIRRLVRENEEIFRAYNFVPKFRTVANTETVLHYVENGGAVALLDQWCYALHYPGFRYMTIDVHQCVALAWRKNTSVASISLFQEMLLEHFCTSQSSPKTV